MKSSRVIWPSLSSSPSPKACLVRYSRTIPCVAPIVTQKRTVASVPVLSSWTVDFFRKESFVPQAPSIIVARLRDLPPAVRKWFTYKDVKSSNSCPQTSKRSELDQNFWRAHGDHIVPLEITTPASESGGSVTFDRINAPLRVLLSHIDSKSNERTDTQSIYLAQHDLRDLPQVLQDDLPTPDLVKLAGKGDLYSSSLWLGRSPTYTPLHRDPNPNLFMQLAGTKVIRLFRPEIGDAIFDHMTKLLHQPQAEKGLPAEHHPRSASFRGEEMMMGRERSLLHDLVWCESLDGRDNSAVLQHAQQARLGMGQVLFIPKGWWHSVKGIGDGVTASANWWFR